MSASIIRVDSGFLIVLLFLSLPPLLQYSNLIKSFMFHGAHVVTGQSICY